MNRDLDPAFGVVDVGAKQQREHERHDGENEQDVGQLGEVLEVHPVDDEHDHPPHHQKPSLFEEKLDAVAVRFVGERADGAVHRDDGRHGQDQGDSPKHTVPFEPLPNASNQFVHAGIKGT